MEAIAPRSLHSKGKSVLAAGAFAGAVAGAAATGTVSKPDAWYRRLEKPPFNPPPWVFGPVWTALYTMMAVSAYRVWRAPKSRDRDSALRLWAGQLVLNAAWSPLFFGRRRPRAALADLAGMHGLISAYTARAARVDRPAAWLMAPYLAWVSFAGVLNAEIVRRNPRLAAR
ncbi:MAG TPA: TspO/MBR family protein [Longimicrobium sp.]|nr:TspO/MBR family protein [Longimicrobium sp.]